MSLDSSVVGNVGNYFLKVCTPADSGTLLTSSISMDLKVPLICKSVRRATNASAIVIVDSEQKRDLFEGL